AHVGLDPDEPALHAHHGHREHPSVHRPGTVAPGNDSFSLNRLRPATTRGEPASGSGLVGQKADSNTKTLGRPLEPAVTLATSNRTASGLADEVARNASARERSLRCFFQVTASYGPPNAAPDRALTSQNTISEPRARTRSSSPSRQVQLRA